MKILVLGLRKVNKEERNEEFERKFKSLTKEEKEMYARLYRSCK